MEWDPWGIYTDASENLYLTGYRDVIHYSNAIVVFDSDTLKLNNAGSSMFFIKMDSSGTVLDGYLFQVTPGNGGGIEPLAVDSSGCYVYWGGAVDTSTVFGNDTVGTSVHPSAIDYPFIARWSDGTCAVTGKNSVETPNPTISLYPNPNTGIFTLVCHSERSEESLTMLQIYNVLGEKVLTKTLRFVEGDNNINISTQQAVFICTGLFFQMEIFYQRANSSFNKFLKINHIFYGNPKTLSQSFNGCICGICLASLNVSNNIFRKPRIKFKRLLA